MSEHSHRFRSILGASQKYVPTASPLPAACLSAVSLGLSPAPPAEHAPKKRRSASWFHPDVLKSVAQACSDCGG